MKNPLSVRVLKPLGDLHQVVELGPGIDRFLPIDLGAQIFAGEELLDEVGQVLLGAEIEGDHDVGVIEAPSDLRLAQETAPSIRTISKKCRSHRYPTWLFCSDLLAVAWCAGSVSASQ